MILIDFMNMAHRCRWAPSFGFGDDNLVYTFLRTFRKTVEDFPGDVHVVFEGRAKRRRELFPEYKGNRRMSTDAPPEEIQAQQDFFRDTQEIEEILKFLPVTLVRHPDHECDDVIAHLARSSEEGATVISTDTDFIQLLSPDGRVKLWNPVKKSWVLPTPHDYVSWKALVGDGTDNIPGVRKGLGDKTAQKILLSDKGVEGSLSHSELNDYARNLELIRFEEVDTSRLLVRRGELRERELLLYFRDKGYRSLAQDKAFYRFVETFSPAPGLFG